MDECYQAAEEGELVAGYDEARVKWGMRGMQVWSN
jgi:hypothetical protein